VARLLAGDRGKLAGLVVPAAYSHQPARAAARGVGWCLLEGLALVLTVDRSRHDYEGSEEHPEEEDHEEHDPRYCFDAAIHRTALPFKPADS
jgi:hypothetical protein